MASPSDSPAATTARHELVGYFTHTGATPEYDPPHEGPCLVCWKPLTTDDIRTISVMPTEKPISLFFRVHRTCAESDPNAVEEIESAIIDGEFPRSKYAAVGRIVPLYDADLNPINREGDDA